MTLKMRLGLDSLSIFSRHTTVGETNDTLELFETFQKRIIFT